MDRMALMQDLVDDYRRVQLIKDDAQDVAAIYPTLIAYAISVTAIKINFTRDELLAGINIGKYRVFADPNDAGTPIKIKELN